MTDIVTPPAITPLPLPPDPNNRSTFNSLAYPWSVAQGVLATEIGAAAANVFNNSTAADERATAAQLARDASTAAKGIAEAARAAAEQAAADAAEHVASLPEGTINDGATAPDSVWSSAKTAEQIEQAKDWPPVGGIALLKTDIPTLTLGGKQFLRSGVLVHPDDVPDWPAWAGQPTLAFGDVESAVTANGLEYQNGTWFSVYGHGGRKSADNFLTNTPFDVLGAVNHICVKGGGQVVVVGGDSSNVGLSTDNGVNWVTKESGLSLVYSLANNASGIWMAGGMLSNKAAVSLSTNNGENWTNLTMPVGFDYPYIAHLNSHNGVWIVGAGTGIWRSVNNGSTWTQVGNFSGLTASMVSVSVDGTWLVGFGGGGGIMRSTDAGLTWVNHPPGLAWPIQVSFATHIKGGKWLAGGSGGDFRQSFDDGITWTAISGVIPAAVNSPCCKSLNGIITMLGIGAAGIVKRQTYGIGLPVYAPYQYLRIA